MRLEFKRVPANEFNSDNLPEWAKLLVTDFEIKAADSFDLGIVHMTTPLVNGVSKEWATLEEIVTDILDYNEQFENEGFNSDPAFVLYSLYKCVECGLVVFRVV